MFNGGRDVVVLPISNDSIEDLVSWASDADFPFLFGSDQSGAVYSSFGGDLRDNGMVGSRAVIVIDPEGKVAKVIPTFRQMDPTAYDELAEVIDAVTPDPDEGS